MVFRITALARRSEYNPKPKMTKLTKNATPDTQWCMNTQLVSSLAVKAAMKHTAQTTPFNATTGHRRGLLGASLRV